MNQDGSTVGGEGWAKVGDGLHFSFSTPLQEFLDPGKQEKVLSACFPLYKSDLLLEINFLNQQFL